MATSQPYLTTATPAERHASLVANSASFSGPLSQEAYLRREAHLANQDLTRGTGLTTYALVQDDPSTPTGRRVLCTCETIRKRGLVALAGHNAAAREVPVLGVASVFTPAENRGKGYAGLMISSLGEAIEREGTAAFSVLYSDVGMFYSRHGWKARESAHVDLPVPLATHCSEALPEYRTLSKAEALALCGRDEEIVKARMQRLAARGKDIVAIVPDEKHLNFLFAREWFLSTELLGKAPGISGALVETSTGDRVWCVWTRWYYSADPSDLSRNSLQILRLVVENANYDDSPATEKQATEAVQGQITMATAALLVAACSAAGESNVSKVTLWNPSATSLAAARLLDSKAKVEHRQEESVASIKLCDPELIKRRDSVIWKCNEKFAWC